MEVTCCNFDGIFQSMVEAIGGCEFAAIDCEFTGLDLNGRRREEYFDDLQQRYARVRTSAHHFLVIQVGLSLFEWHCAKEKYQAKTYNCYVYPRPHGALDHRFTCQASSLEFLSKHKFDFNKFVYEGIPFLNLAATDLEYAKLDHQAAPPASLSTAAAPPLDALPRSGRDIRDALRSDEDKQRHRALIERVQRWLSAGHGRHRAPSAERDDLQAGEGAAESAPQQAPAQAEVPVTTAQGNVSPDVMGAPRIADAASDSSDVLVFEPMNSFWRAVVYQTMEREFGKERFIVEKVPQSVSSNFESLRLVRSTREAVLAAEQTRLAEKRARFDRAVGFSQVLRALSHARIPIVGHNMLLDLAYLFHQFVHPLPPTLQGFRDLVGSFFPGGIYDTKHLAVQVPEAFPPFAGTALDAVFKNFGIRVDYERPTTHAQIPGGQVHENMAAVRRVGGLGLSAPSGREREAESTDLQPPGTLPEMSAVVQTSPADTVACAVAEALVESAAPSYQHADADDRHAATPDLTEEAAPEGFSQLLTGSAKQAPRVSDAMPSVEHADGFTRYSETEDGPPEFGHEAGFDAFMTGVAFVGLAKSLEVRRDEPELVAHRLFRENPPLSLGCLAKRPPTRSGPARQPGAGAGRAEHECAVTSTKEAGAATDARTTEEGVDGRETDLSSALLVPPSVPPSGCPILPPATERTAPATQAPTHPEAAASADAIPSAGGPQTDEEEERALRRLLERTSRGRVNMEVLRPYAYRINLMGSDIPHLPLQGPLIVPERGHVFHISGFSEDTRYPEIAGRFAALGLGYVDVTWIDRTSAFVALRSRTLADQVIDSVIESGWEVDIVGWADSRLQAQGQPQEHRSWHIDDSLAQTTSRQGTSKDGGTSHLRKGRRLMDGGRTMIAVIDSDDERDARRALKSMPVAPKTCSIL